MAATIPTAVAATPFHDTLDRAGLNRIHQGKVRDTYALPDKGLLLVLATDRMSIFDFVLPALVPHKGELLTALTVFWLTEVLTYAHHHLVAFGADMNEYLPPELRNNDELYKRALVVRKLTMIPVECVVRGYLTGSGLKSYRETQCVCGIPLPAGLHDGSRILPHPIFTPTTKAQSGHDEHLPADTVQQQYGAWLANKSLLYYQKLAAVAHAKSIILADTKFEFGKGGVLADEVGTPDSSRFWDRDEWIRAWQRQQSPPPFDKELVRSWGKDIATPFADPQGEGGDQISGLGNLDPENPEHLKFVSVLAVPSDVLNETNQRYRIVLQRLTGLELKEFQKVKLGVT